MTRTAALIRAELAAVRQRCSELELVWIDRTEVPPDRLSELLLQVDQLKAELAELGGEDAP